MKVINRYFDAALEIEIPRFGDDRGWFSVPYEANAAAEIGLTEPFVQDNHSMSATVGTVRGIHLQLPPHDQGKLVRVTEGRVLDIVVDLRPDSPTLGEWAGIEISAEAGNQVWVPRGFGHGFRTLEPNSHLVYKVDNGYAPQADRSLAWDDPTIGVKWGIDAADATLSDKDRAGSPFADIMADIKQALEGAS